MRLIGRALVAIAILTAIVQCNKVDDFGESYIDENEYKVEEYDLVNFTIESLPQDSLTMFAKDSILSPTSLLGELNYGNFGQTKAIINAQYKNLRVLDFTDRILDSARLTFVYDTAFGVYGSPLSSFDITVKELIEPIGDLRYHFENIATDERILGQLNDYTFRPKAVKENVDTTAKDTTYSSIPLRIPIDLDWAQRFVTLDTITQDSAELFLDFFKGFKIEATKRDETGGIVLFNFTNENSRFDLFYHHKDSTTAYRYELIPFTILGGAPGPTRALFNQFNNSFLPDSVITQALGSANLGNALIKVTIPMTEELKSLNVNDAYLEMVINTSIQDTTRYRVNDNLWCYIKNGDRFDKITDYAYQSQGLYGVYFGTVPKRRTLDDNTRQLFYRIKFTNQMRTNIKKGEDLVFYIIDPNNKFEPNRTLFYPPGSTSGLSPKIRILHLTDQKETNTQ